MRLVVVGDYGVFSDWLRTLPRQDRERIKPVMRWSDMLGHRTSTVEFMQDWRSGSARPPEENDRIWNEAVALDEYRRSLLDPFNAKGGK